MADAREAVDELLGAGPCGGFVHPREQKSREWEGGNWAPSSGRRFALGVWERCGEEEKGLCGGMGMRAMEKNEGNMREMWEMRRCGKMRDKIA